MVLANSTIAEAYSEAADRFTKRNPNSLAMSKRAAEAMPGGNTRTVLHYDPFPLTFESASGCTVHDADGHDLTDFLGEYTAGLYGHNDPRILAAMDTAARDGIVLGGPNMVEAKFAALITDRFPALDLVRFTNSGTEANLMALGAARAFTGRDRIIAFEGGYHGGVLYFAAPSPINAPFPVTLTRYNDAAAAEAAILEAGDKLAAVIVEPMIGSGGCIPGSAEFLRTLRTATEKVGALLVFDEVMTSRLSPGGRHGELGISPDLVSLGKYLGGGMSFGAFGGRGDIMEHFDPRKEGAWPHAGTFNNNIMTMSAGYAGLSQIFTPEVCASLNATGDTLRRRLNDVAESHDIAMQFTGMGSMMNVHFQRSAISAPQDKSTPGELVDLFHLDMIEAGIYCARRGMMNLSLPMQSTDHDRLVMAIEEFILSRKSLLTTLDG